MCNSKALITRQRMVLKYQVSERNPTKKGNVKKTPLFSTWFVVLIHLIGAIWPPNHPNPNQNCTGTLSILESVFRCSCFMDQSVLTLIGVIWRSNTEMKFPKHVTTWKTCQWKMTSRLRLWPVVQMPYFPFFLMFKSKCQHYNVAPFLALSVWDQRE